MAHVAAMRYRLGMSLFLRAARPILHALPQTLANNILSAAWLPYFTWVLTPTDLGLLGLTICGARALELIGTLRLDQGIASVMAGRDDAERPRIRNAAITFAATNHLVLIAGAAALAWIVPSYAWVFLLAACLAALRLPASLFVAEHAEPRLKLKRTMLMTGRSLAAVVLMIALISWLGMAWEGRIVALVVAEAVTAFVCWFVLSDIGRRYRPQLGEGLVLTFAIVGAPLVVRFLGIWGLENTDRLVALHAFTLVEVGYYVAALRVAMLVLLVNRSFASSLQPLLRELAAAGNVCRLAMLHAGFTVFGLTFAGAMAAAFYHYADEILGPQFQDAARIIAVVVAAAGIHSAFQLGRQIRFLYPPNPFGGLKSHIAVAIQLAVTFALLGPLGTLAPAAGDVAGRIAASLAMTWAVYTMVGRVPVTSPAGVRAAVEPRDDDL